MNKMRFFLTGIVVLIFCSVSFATQLKTLTLSESINIALEQNKSIAAAKQDVKASEARLRESVLNWFPHFSFNVDSHYYKKTPYQANGATTEVEIIPGIRIPSSFLATTGNEYYDTDLGLSITQLLFDSGKVSSQIVKARANLALSKLTLLRTMRDVNFQIRKSYYQLLKLDKVVSVQEKKLEHAKSLLYSSEKKYEEGKIGHLEILENQINVAKVEHELSLMLEEKLDKKNEILQLLNLPYDAEISPNEKINFIPFVTNDPTKIVSETRHHNLNIQEANLNLKLKESSIISSNSDMRPDANLYGSLHHYKTADTLSESWENFDKYWAVGLRLDWSFFDSGKSWNKINAANRDFKGAKITLDDTISKVIIKARNLYQKLKNAKKKVEIFERNKELTKARLQIAERFYEKERISLTELMAKEIAFEEAKVDGMNSIIEYEIIRLDLYKIMGREYK